MAIGKQTFKYIIGEVYQSDNGVLYGRINGQKVFLNEFEYEDRKTGQKKKKWLIEQNIDAYLTDPKPKPGDYDQDFQG